MSSRTTPPLPKTFQTLLPKESLKMKASLPKALTESTAPLSSLVTSLIPLPKALTESTAPLSSLVKPYKVKAVTTLFPKTAKL